MLRRTVLLDNFRKHFEMEVVKSGCDESIDIVIYLVQTSLQKFFVTSVVDRSSFTRRYTPPEIMIVI